MVTIVSLVPIYHLTVLILCYWLYSLHGTIHPNDLFIIWQYVLLPILPSYSQPPSPLATNTLSLYLWVWILFCFLDFKHKRDHALFVFLSALLHLSSIHVTANSKSSFFFMAEKYLQIYNSYGWVIYKSINQSIQFYLAINPQMDS